MQTLKVFIKLIFICIMLNLCAINSIKAQPQLLHILEGKFNLFYTDNLNNVFTVSKNQIIRFDPKGRELFRTGYLNLGPIFSADFTFTLKPLVFHRDFLTIATLDNTLSMQGRPVNLIDLGIPNATLVCSSFDNHFWVYNQDNFEFLRLNFQGQRVSRTGSMQQLIAREIEPVYMLERNNNLYVSDPRLGIIVFDIFGTYFKTIGERNIDEFQVFDDFIFFERDGKLNRFHLITLDLKTFEMPHQNFMQIRVEKRRLFLLTEKGVEVYAFNPLI